MTKRVRAPWQPQASAWCGLATSKSLRLGWLLYSSPTLPPLHEVERGSGGEGVPLNPVRPALSLGGAERRGGARQQVLRLDRCVARVADGIVAGAQARCRSGQRLDPAGEPLGQKHRARAVGAGRDHRELSRADAPDRVGAAGRAAQHVGEQVHGDGILAIGGDRREGSEEHTSELQSPCNLVCRLLLEKKKNKTRYIAK